MPSRRTVLSIIRTVGYVALAVVLALWRTKAPGLASAALAGAVLGDYLTWVIWSVIELPEHVWHGSYEACVNLLFGVWAFRIVNLNPTADLSGELMAVMFLTCLLVGGVKSFYLGIVFVEKEIDDDN